MRHIFIPVAVLVILFCVFISGCTSNTAPAPPAATTPVPVTTFTPSPTTTTVPVTAVQTPCPSPSGNATPYIIINPVSHFTFGDSIEITGTTNIGFSKNIRYGVIPAAMPSPIGVQPYYPLLPQGDVRIIGGDCYIQTWSFILDTSNCTLTGGLYVGSDNLTFPNGTSHKVWNTTEIRVHQANGGPTWGEIGWIP
jgi:hypothetical protein